MAISATCPAPKEPSDQAFAQWYKTLGKSSLLDVLVTRASSLALIVGSDCPLSTTKGPPLITIFTSPTDCPASRSQARSITQPLQRNTTDTPATPHAGHHFARYEATTDVPAFVARARRRAGTRPRHGNRFERFDAAKLTRVYGVEPNTAFAGMMVERLAATPGGLRDKYTPIFCGVEDGAELAKHGIVPGSLDCVVSMQVLCSVPKPREVARQLYDLLKPGGEILFWEHQRNEDWLGWAVQCKR